MKKEYAEWIAKHEHGSCRDMILAFPELRLEHGHYFDYDLGEVEHRWLLTPEDEVIDPVAHQFPSKGNGIYIPNG